MLPFFLPNIIIVKKLKTFKKKKKGTCWVTVALQFRVRLNWVVFEIKNSWACRLLHRLKCNGDTLKRSALEISLWAPLCRLFAFHKAWMFLEMMWLISGPVGLWRLVGCVHPWNTSSWSRRHEREVPTPVFQRCFSVCTNPYMFARTSSSRGVWEFNWRGLSPENDVAMFAFLTLSARDI